MRILLTNDDGVLAPGLAALYRAVADLGEVSVVAPETTQSAMSHAISISAPLRVRRVHANGVFHGVSVDGSPTDCVKLAMLELLEERPDFVLSGINSGANAGVNVRHSGTVAGAAEGAMFGVPSMAFSLQYAEEVDFAAAGAIAREVFRAFAASNPEPGLCVNVNIPALDAGPPLGVRCCANAAIPMQQHYRHDVGPDGETIYWLDGWEPQPEQPAGTDQRALRERYVSVTPLRFDQTDYAVLEKLAEAPWPKSFR